MPPRRFHDSIAFPFIGDVGLFGLHYSYSFRAFSEKTKHDLNVEKNGGDTFRIIDVGGVYVLSQSGRVIFTETGEGSRTTAERAICFRGTQTVPTAACDRRLT